MSRTRPPNRPYMPLWDHPEVAQAIGIVTGEWSALEYTLCMMLGKLLGNQDELAESIYFSLGSHKARRDLIAAAILSVMAEEEREHLLNVLDEVTKLANRRNALAHDQWGLTNKNKLVRISKQPRAKNRQPVYETPKNIYALADDIANLRWSLLFLNAHLYNEFDSSPGTLE